MCFSDFYAKNVSLSDYYQHNSFFTSEYPMKDVVDTQIQNSSNRAELMNGTVLAVLRPTVLISSQGSQDVLKKGVYIIHNA
jgi:hypothetical protein